MITISKDSAKEYSRADKEFGAKMSGSILKLFDTTKMDKEEKALIEKWKQMHISNSQKVAKQQEELLQANEQMEKDAKKLNVALDKAKKSKEEADRAKLLAENARAEVEKELDAATKKVQTELMGTVANAAMYFVAAIVVLSAILYTFAMFFGDENESVVLANLLATIFVAVVSSSFSVVGTILGIREMSKGGVNTNASTEKDT